MNRNVLLYKSLYHKGKLLLCLALVSVAIFSCSKKDAAILEQTKKVSTSVEAATSDPLRPNVIIQETFEGSTYFPVKGTDLNVISGIENCGSSWTLSRVTTPVFQDAKSSRFEIRKDQPLVGGSQRIRSEVNIIVGSDDNRFSPEMWYSFAALFPSNGGEYDETRDCINQWYENGNSETTLRVQKDRVFLEVCPPAGSSVMKEYDLFATSLTGDGTLADFEPIPKDQWHEFVFHFKHSLDDDGFIEVWRDGLKIHSIKGRNIHKQMPKWKVGMYKYSFMDNTSPWYSRVVYFDNIRVGKATAKFSEMSSDMPAAAKSTSVNKNPIANAGADMDAILQDGSIYLTGSVYDPDGSVKSVAWSQVSGPDGGTLSGQNTTHLKLMNPQYGKYVFRLTVTDDRGGIDKDDVVVNVTSTVNILPSADAGPDQIIAGSTTTLDGSKSVDPDGSIVKYEWSVSSGVDGWSKFVVFNTPGAAKTTVSGLKPGSYVFRLTITDNKGATAIDKLTVTYSTSGSGPAITGFTLIDAATDNGILTITNGTAYSISKLGTTRFNVRANTSGAASVKFVMTGEQSRTFTDSQKPFALMSDDGNGNYYYGNWNPPAVGDYTLKATPYSATGASGTAGTASTIKFSFTN